MLAGLILLISFAVAEGNKAILEEIQNLPDATPNIKVGPDKDGCRDLEPPRAHGKIRW